MKKEQAPLATTIATLSILMNISFTVFLLSKPSANNTQTEQDSPLSFAQVNSSSYPFLSKRIFTENQNDILINFIPLREALSGYADEQKHEVGIYFEYLPSGNSIGVNDRMEINLASLIKIPVVMGVYKEIEAGRLKKEDLITLNEEDLDAKFGTLWQKGAGTQLTIKDAIELALIESDNTASQALLRQIPIKNIDHVFDSLDVPKDTKDEYHIISPKNYSSILRSLYLASYLSRDTSNEILEILTRTKFNDKIAAGVPQDIKVSHKIGVFRSLENQDETYSDCGIIYVPRRPYLLCIMTRSTEAEAKEYMSHISKIVHGYIIATKRSNE
jgi:beta-lactamase class A